MSAGGEVIPSPHQTMVTPPKNSWSHKNFRGGYPLGIHRGRFLWPGAPDNGPSMNIDPLARLRHRSENSFTPGTDSHVGTG
ncbi:hypothetical protein HMPREF0290_2621 [Corynebacterium efficiens YS-314]|uniref:Uncharacterized protein n=1 Tax=Corynebacterium efficiens (strain DSM 44549 / YS-314 / AJ 12310 / JCM 11189 / NBRC 100395) TaxID=196164 RepID=Q8FUB1_COREF|nr:hypothetical protein HMPREF0290_2621 [Corynebacterium efficiens YS-314]BAC16919.1 hypothetical protein [Corynebacterium efficiens YS-314]